MLSTCCTSLLLVLMFVSTDPKMEGYCSTSWIAVISTKDLSHLMAVKRVASSYPKGRV